MTELLAVRTGGIIRSFLRTGATDVASKTTGMTSAKFSAGGVGGCRCPGWPDTPEAQVGHDLHELTPCPARQSIDERDS